VPAVSLTECPHSITVKPTVTQQAAVCNFQACNCSICVLKPHPAEAFKTICLIYPTATTPKSIKRQSIPQFNCNSIVQLCMSLHLQCLLQTSPTSDHVMHLFNMQLFKMQLSTHAIQCSDCIVSSPRNQSHVSSPAHKTCTPPQCVMHLFNMHASIQSAAVNVSNV
jgi:hypothetical protein